MQLKIIYLTCYPRIFYVIVVDDVVLIEDHRPTDTYVRKKLIQINSSSGHLILKDCTAGVTLPTGIYLVATFRVPMIDGEASIHGMGDTCGCSS